MGSCFIQKFFDSKPRKSIEFQLNSFVDKMIIPKLFFLNLLRSSKENVLNVNNCETKCLLVATSDSNLEEAFNEMHLNLENLRPSVPKLFASKKSWALIGRSRSVQLFGSLKKFSTKTIRITKPEKNFESSLSSLALAANGVSSRSALGPY